MIYIPIELQLQWIREYIDKIKRHLCTMDYIVHIPSCPDCNFAIATGLSTSCTNHVPEYSIRINFPFTD